MPELLTNAQQAEKEPELVLTTMAESALTTKLYEGEKTTLATNVYQEAQEDQSLTKQEQQPDEGQAAVVEESASKDAQLQPQYESPTSE